MGALTSRRAVGLLLAALVWLVPSRALAQSETTEYYGLDTTGSVRVVFDAAGTVLTRVDYGPFGEQLAAAPGAPNDKYAGLFRDDETGLDYAQARQYNPRIGRFTSLDPVYSGLFEPQRWNRYTYALNSPLTFVDPDGLLADSGISGLCSAENSFGRCGGDSLFWDTSGGNGFTFGDGYVHAQNLGYVPGMPENVWADLQSFQVRAETAFAQSREAAQQSSKSAITTSETFRAAKGGDGETFSALAKEVTERTSPLTKPSIYGELFLLSAAPGVARAAFGAAGLSIEARAYPNAGGGGVLLNRLGDNIIRLDWHTIPTRWGDISVPHVDIPHVVKHWPW